MHDRIPPRRSGVRAALLVGLLTLLATMHAVAETIVPVAPALLHRPVISGDWIVWGELGGTQSTASVYAAKWTIPSPVVYTLAEETAWLYDWAPWSPQIAIDGTRVVWLDKRFEGSEAITQFYLADLAESFTEDQDTYTAHKLGPATRDYGTQFAFPNLSGDRLIAQAWRQDGSLTSLEAALFAVTMTPGADDTTTYGLDFMARSVDPDVPNGTWAVPDVDGDYVVWVDTSGANAGVYWSDDFNGQTMNIIGQASASLPAGSMHRPPVIAGARIAWCVRVPGENPEDPGTIQVVVYDIASGEIVFAVETGSMLHRSNVALGGDLVVWEDWHSNPGENPTNIDLMGYDLVAGEFFVVADGPGNQHLPDMAGGVIVWVDGGIDGASPTIRVTNLIPEPTSAVILILGLGLSARRRH